MLAAGAALKTSKKKKKERKRKKKGIMRQTFMEGNLMHFSIYVMRQVDIHAVFFFIMYFFVNETLR